MADFKSPFAFFGAKSAIAAEVWRRFGDVPCYTEPFVGSAAVLLKRPGWSPAASWVETVNDKDGMISNFWRAVQHDPEQTAHYADWPSNENDLHARHAWLVNQKFNTDFVAQLEGDPDYYDAKIAGWWVWGMANWIGGGFCSGNGPWQSVDGKLVNTGDAGVGVQRHLVHLSNAGRGVQRRRVQLSNAGQGVQRRRVHLGNAGQGVQRRRVYLGNAGQGEAGTGEQGLLAWFEALSARLRRVRVCSGDWQRTVASEGALGLHMFQPVGVFLDPPYSLKAGRDMSLYAEESGDVAHAVREWAIAHGDDPRFRIALCGYDTEHAMPENWSVYRWSAKGGYGNLGNGRGATNRHRETVWFSPHCLAGDEQRQLNLWEPPDD